jgi:hypothetical protein
MSVCIRKLLRLAISTQAFLVVPCIQENAEVFHRFPVVTADFSCSPLYLNSSKYNPPAAKGPKLFPNYSVHHSFGNSKSRGPCLKPLLLTVITASFLHCPHQKDERAKPGNLLTKRSAFSPCPNVKCVSLLP